MAQFSPLLWYACFYLCSGNVSEQLVEKLKAMPELHNTPIVIVSYKDSEKERARFAKCGCDHFLSKVASPQDIKLLLANLINQAA